MSKKCVRTLLLFTWLLSVPACAAPTTDPCLPFAMPPADEVLNSKKKVFAHYFWPLPLSIDNKNWWQDYYTVQFLNPHGERDKFLQAGGLLRGRPLRLPPKASPDWRMLNMAQEIRMAIARGINGFAFDVMNTHEAAAGGKLLMMLKAAESVDPRFKIMLMPDMVGLKDTSNVAAIVRAVHTNPALYRWGDGRLVLAPFRSEILSPGAWSSMLNMLKGEGINIAFLPTFLSLQQTYVDQYDDISVGLGLFGATATPDQLKNAFFNADRVRRSKAPVFMDGITPQAYKPSRFFYYEANNSLAYRNGWAGAIQTKADMIQIATWNDFGESTHISPATSATGDSGNGFYNLTGYYSTWFRTGAAPAITHDVLYYFYRKEPNNAVAPAQKLPVKLVPESHTPQNQIEVLAFLASSGTITVTIGGKTYSQSAGAGVNSFTVPLAPGTPLITLRRGSSVAVKVAGNPQIYPADKGLPSGVLDLTYWSGSASAAGACTIPMQ
ncbi:MAG: hypothetical protein L0Y60_01910 [Beijerinckiaceae bacterium]|nr:hypothetical protein [Beijerinckiaceae bacterium]